MIVYDRLVQFADIDAAGIVFFGRFLFYCHEAMDRLLAEVKDGYPDIVLRRRIGFPAVNVNATFTSPLRFGDTARIELTATRIGTTSATLHYAFRRASDAADVATIDHVLVAISLDTMKKIPLPDDIRAVLASHAT